MKKSPVNLFLISALLLLSLTLPVLSSTETIDHPPKNEKIFSSLVSEETRALFLINDAKLFFTTWKDNPLVKIWHNKAIQKEFKPFRLALQQPRWKRWSKEMFGHSIEELITLFSGEIMLNLPDFPLSSDIQFIADIGTSQKEVSTALATFMQYQQNHLQEGEQYIEEQESFLTTEIYTRLQIDSEQSKEHFSWAIVDHYLVVSNAKESLQTILLALDEGSVENSLSGSDSYESMHNAHGQYDSLLYVNNSLLSAIIHEQFKANEEPDDEELPFSNMGDLLDSAGLDSIYITAREEDQQTLVNISAYHKTDSALMSLFKVAPQEMKWPVFIDGEPLSASISLFDFSHFWEQFKAQPEASPLASYITMVTFQLSQLSESSGMDFEKALIDGLGQTIYSASYKSSLTELSAEDISNYSEEDSEMGAIIPEPEHYLYAFTLADQQSVNLALNVIKKEYNFTPYVTEKKYLDVNIQVYNPYAFKDLTKVNNVFAYVFSDNLLIVSNYVPLLENAVSQIRHKNTQHSFANKDEIKEMMALLANNVTGISYSNGTSFLTSSSEMLSTLQLIALPAPEQNGCRMSPPAETNSTTTTIDEKFHNVLKSVHYSSYDEMNASRYTLKLNYFQ